MRRWPWLMMLLTAVMLVGAACSDSSGSNDTTTSAATSGTTATTGASATTGTTSTSGATGTSGATSGPSSSGGGSEGGTITIDGEKANDHGSADVSGRSEFELEADDYYFDPTTLKGTPGQTVKLEIKNEGTTEHNFTVEDQNIDQDIEAGEDATVSIKFPASGSVEFHCEYHHSMGMVGQLEAS